MYEHFVTQGKRVHTMWNRYFPRQWNYEWDFSQSVESNNDVKQKRTDNAPLY